MANKQLFLNNVETTFLTAIKDTPVTGTPATELGYGILQVNTSTSAAMTNPTGGDYYMMTALKRAGSVESTIEVMKVTAVDTVTFPGECRLTVLRAQEGTTAKAYLAGDYFAMRVTKATLENLQQAGDKDASGGIPGLTLFKLNLRNAANTVTSWFTTAATVARTWTLPDKDGTVAMTSDITGTNSGTNTGDQTITLTSEATGSGTGSFAVTLTNSAVIGKVLTGYTSGAGTVAATDTILQAVNKLNGNDALKQTLAAKDATGGYAGLTLFKINFKNVANTFTSFFTNSNTAARTYTFQDRDGTIADNTDLALKSNALNPIFTGRGSISGAGGYLPPSTTIAAATGMTSGLDVTSQGTAGTAGAAFMTFHRPGAHAVHVGLDTDNFFKIGGFSLGAVSYKIWHEGSDGAGSGLDADLLDGQQGTYYQQALVSGTNIKTVNGASLLGSGDIVISSGGAASSIYLANTFGAL